MVRKPQRISGEVHVTLVLIGLVVVGAIILWQYMATFRSTPESLILVPIAGQATRYGNSSIEARITLVAQPVRFRITNVSALVIFHEKNYTCNVSSISRTEIPPRVPTEIVFTITCQIVVDPGAHLILRFSWTGGNRSGVEEIQLTVN